MAVARPTGPLLCAVAVASSGSHCDIPSVDDGQAVNSVAMRPFLPLWTKVHAQRVRVEDPIGSLLAENLPETGQLDGLAVMGRDVHAGGSQWYVRPPGEANGRPNGLRSVSSARGRGPQARAIPT